jgi:hypothetical protein
VTVAVWFAAREYEPPATTLKGAEVDAEPVSVPPPTFFTVTARSAVAPTPTEPKATLAGVAWRAGVGAPLVSSSAPMSERAPWGRTVPS